MVENDFHHIAGWEKPIHAPDHPYWHKEYRDATEKYRRTAQSFADILYGQWLGRGEEMKPSDIALELAVLKTRWRGATQEPKPTDNITMYDLYAASTWGNVLDQASFPNTFNDRATAILHRRERHERFEALVLDAYMQFEHPRNEPLPSWIRRDAPTFEVG
ncbi:MAG: hypothetical protein KJ065_04470 [Anaerolineae bacterium]|nr:hypothetical protein [Anaerolineae bacterium]